VLLPSLQGAAVTAIKIEGVLHEFSSLAGVREVAFDGLRMSAGLTSALYVTT
jgi:collagenase-like PrtC family protease